jgi:HEAT repeat protein
MRYMEKVMPRGFLLFCASCAVAATSTAQAPIERAWTLLKQGASDPDDDKRAKAVHALGLLSKNDDARRLAESALADPKPDVRAVGATALGQIGLRASAAKLKEALKDPETEVVFSATTALFALGDPAAHEVYYAVLMGERKTGDALVQSQLDRLKDPEALAKISFEAGVGFIPFGGISYKVFKSIHQDHATPVRAAAAKKLASDPDPRSAQALAKACSDEKWLVRASVVSAIAERGDKKLLAAVIPLLDDPEEIVRFTAAAAVVRLGGE